jgi:deazaflavin-dependent oxidoreductase (nitroreductase family)
MPTATRGPVLKIFWRMHKWILRASGGKLFARIGKLPVLLLYTKGRKSGEARMNALSYVAHGNAYAVVASNAGADFHPGWWLNLREMPEADIQIRGQRMKVKWSEAIGNEKDEIFAEFVKAEPGYAEYRERTKREMPVVVLEPKA